MGIYHRPTQQYRRRPLGAPLPQKGIFKKLNSKLPLLQNCNRDLSALYELIDAPSDTTKADPWGK